MAEVAENGPFQKISREDDAGATFVLQSKGGSCFYIFVRLLYQFNLVIPALYVMNLSEIIFEQQVYDTMTKRKKNN